MKAFRVDLRTRVAAAGRNPDNCKIFYVVMPTVGESNDGGRGARAAPPGAAARPRPRWRWRRWRSLTDIDFSQLRHRRADRRAHHQRPAGHAQALPQAGQHAARDRAELPLCATRIWSARPSTVAAQMAEVMRGGRRRRLRLQRQPHAPLRRRDHRRPRARPAAPGPGAHRLRARALPRQPFGLLMPPLGKMILRRLLWVFPVAFGVVTMTFFMARVLNGDPTELYAPPEATDALRAEIRAKLGLADPLPMQFIHYLWRPAALRSRHVLHHRPERGVGSVGPAAGDARARPGRAGAGHRRRHPARRDGGRPSRALARLPGARHDLERHGAAAVLGRAGADQHLLRRPALAAGAGRPPADRHSPCRPGSPASC